MPRAKQMALYDPAFVLVQRVDRDESLVAQLRFRDYHDIDVARAIEVAGGE